MPDYGGRERITGKLPALRCTARGQDATLIPVLAWVPSGGEIANHGSPSGYLWEIWRDDAWPRLWDAVNSASGGIPADVRAEPTVLRGEPDGVLARVASQAGLSIKPSG